MNVYFKNSQSIERLIGTTDTDRDCFEIINNFLNEHNYKSHYRRVMGTDKGKRVDVGLYPEFFYIIDDYYLLKDKILKDMKVKIRNTSYGVVTILSYYCKNEEEFRLASKFEGESKSYSRLKDKDLYKNEKFRGADWYFFYEDDTSGDAHFTEMKYFTETLTEKKEKFKEFCKFYEEN